MYIRSNIMARLRNHCCPENATIPGHVASMEVNRNTNMALVGKPEGKIPLGRPRCRWEDNIEMDLQEAGWGHAQIWLRIGTSGGLL